MSVSLKLAHFAVHEIETVCPAGISLRPDVSHDHIT